MLETTLRKMDDMVLSRCFVAPTVAADGFSYGQAVRIALGLSWNPQKRALAVTARGSGSVRVNGSLCSRSCRRQFDEGLIATLRAQPARGSRLSGWSGACSGRKPSCTLLMDRGRSAVARFVR